MPVVNLGLCSFKAKMLDVIQRNGATSLEVIETEYSNEVSRSYSTGLSF